MDMMIGSVLVHCLSNSSNLSRNLSPVALFDSFGLAQTRVYSTDTLLEGILISWVW
jgi:hypothetical protein